MLKVTMRRLGVALVVAGAALAGTGARAEQGFKYGGVFGFGYTFGGSKIATLNYTDGSTQDLKGGGRFLFKIGGELRFKDYPVDLQSTIGWHVDNDVSSNGDVRYSRFPLEAMAYYRLPSSSWRLGGGFRYNYNTKLSAKVNNVDLGTVHFNSNYGRILEGEYFFYRNASVAVRHVWEDVSLDYQGSRLTGSGSHTGVVINLFY